jgi:hypothetical protein
MATRPTTAKSGAAVGDPVNGSEAPATFTPPVGSVIVGTVFPEEVAATHVFEVVTRPVVDVDRAGVLVEDVELLVVLEVDDEVVEGAVEEVVEGADEVVEGADDVGLTTEDVLVGEDVPQRTVVLVTPATAREVVVVAPFTVLVVVEDVVDVDDVEVDDVLEVEVEEVVEVDDVVDVDEVGADEVVVAAAEEKLMSPQTLKAPPKLL